LPVIKKEMSLKEAKELGAIGLFEDKYGERVSVYFIGGEENNLKTAYSKEICGGPHVINTNVLGYFKIIKEEAVSSGVRRIKAILE
jgi:alanyl-tRNA synthetase